MIFQMENHILEAKRVIQLKSHRRNIPRYLVILYLSVNSVTSLV